MNSEFASCQSVVKVKWLVVIFICYWSHVLSVCVPGSAQGWPIAEKTTVPGGTGGKEPACQCRRPKRCRFHPWVRKIPWRRAWQRMSVFLPGESHGQRSLVGFSPEDHKESVKRLSLHAYMYDWIAVQRKLTQHCQSTILQFKIFFNWS